MNNQSNISIFHKIFTKAGLFAIALVVQITAVYAATIDATDGFIRETIPGTEISSAYMTLTNTGEKDVKLVGATSDFSPKIEIHEHSMTNGMMSMRQVDSIDIKANDSVVLQPSGLHLMIFELPAALKAGENKTITLHFDAAPDVEVSLPIKGIKRKKHH